MYINILKKKIIKEIIDKIRVSFDFNIAPK